MTASLASCGGGDGGGGGLKIRGRIAQPVAAPLVASLPGFAAVNPGDVAFYAAFSPGGGHWSGPVTGGAFEMDVAPSGPLGIVFADSARRFLGSLALPSGLSAIPLQAVSDGVQTIDLGTLISSGTQLTAGHDPVGAEIPLSGDDLVALGFVEGMMGSVVRRPDVDGDGIVDVLQGRFYRPSVLYGVDAGGFGGGTAGLPAIPAPFSAYRFCVEVRDAGPFPPAITFTGPAGSGVTGMASDANPMIGTDRAIYCTIPISSPALPPGGTWTAVAGARTLTFDIPDQSAATESVALSVPAVTLNADGTVRSLAWSYQLASGSGSVAPEALIGFLIVAIDGDGSADAPPCPANGGVPPYQGNRAYNSPQFGSSVTDHVLACQNIKWTAVRSIYMAYNDLYGNHMVVTWR